MQNFRNEIICGDCEVVLKSIPDNSISCCITDPPYNYEFIGKSWDESEIERRLDKAKHTSSILVKNLPYGSGLAGGVRNKNWYRRNRDNIIEYQQWIGEWGKELYRVLKPGSLVFVFNSTRTIAHVQVGLENQGFYTRDIIVWRRNSGIPKGINIAKKLEKMGSSDADNWYGWHSCLRNEWEGILVTQKPLINNYIETLEKYHIGLFHTETGQGFQSNIIENIKRETLDNFNTHPTVKPLKLIEKLLELSVPQEYNHIVLDPFAGSGTTLLAAKMRGIDYLGIEINQDYVDIAKKRLEHQKKLVNEDCLCVAMN